MKIILLCVIIAAILLIALFVRYRFYRNWEQFLDEAFEQLTLSFLPDGARILVIIAAVGGIMALVISHYTKDLRASAPGTAPLPATSSMKNVVGAADMPSADPGQSKNGASPPQAGSEAAPTPPPLPNAGDRTSTYAKINTHEIIARTKARGSQSRVDASSVTGAASGSLVSIATLATADKDQYFEVEKSNGRTFVGRHLYNRSGKHFFEQPGVRLSPSPSLI